MNKVGAIILGIIVLVAFSVIGFYNSMLGMDEGLKSLQAQVDNMYERRVDLIPQLTAVVKKYTEYEAGTLTDIVALREGTANLEKLQQMADAGEVKSAEFSNLFASTLSTIKLSVEAYPQLKADTQFTALFTELEGSENRIRTAIKDFNDNVGAYNLRTRSFPRGFLFGRMLGFAPKERITPPADKPIKAVPDVDTLLDNTPPAPQEPTKPIVNNNSDTINNLKRYLNTEFGLTFEYPSNREIVNEPKFDQDGNFQGMWKPIGGEDQIYFTKLLYGKFGEQVQNKETWMEGINSNKDKVEFPIKGGKAYFYRESSKIGAEPTIVLIGDEHIFTLSYFNSSGKTTQNEAEKIIKQIASTFEFVTIQ